MLRRPSQRRTNRRRARRRNASGRRTRSAAASPSAARCSIESAAPACGDRPLGRVLTAVCYRQSLELAGEAYRDPMLSLGNPGAEFLRLAFELSIDAGRADNLAVHERSHFQRLRARRPASVIGRSANYIFRGHREEVHRVERIRHAQAALIVVENRQPGMRIEEEVVEVAGPAPAGRLIPGHGRLHCLRSVYRGSCHAFGSRQIFLHLDGGKRKHIADGVEPIAGVILREIVRRPEIHP